MVTDFCLIPPFYIKYNNVFIPYSDLIIFIYIMVFLSKEELKRVLLK